MPRHFFIILGLILVQLLTMMECRGFYIDYVDSERASRNSIHNHLASTIETNLMGGR